MSLADKICTMFDALADPDPTALAKGRSMQREMTLAKRLQIDAAELPRLLDRIEAAHAHIPSGDLERRARFDDAAADTLTRLGFVDAALDVTSAFHDELATGNVSEKASPYVARVLFLHMTLLRAHSRYEQALAVADTALGLAGDEGTLACYERSRLHEAIATIHLDLGNRVLMAQHLEQQQQYAEAMGNEPNWARFRNQRLGAVREMQAAYRRLCGKPASVLKQLEDLATKNGDQLDARSTMLRGMAHRDLSLNDPTHRGPAIADLEASRASTTLQPSELAEVDVLLGDLYTEEGDFESARAHLAAARQHQTWSTGFGDQQAVRIMALESRLARLSMTKPFDDSARAALRQRVQPLRDAFDGFLRSWRDSTPERKAGIGFLTPQHRRVFLAELIELVWAVDGEAAAADTLLELLLQVQTLGTLARELGVGGITRHDVETRLLNDGDGVLLFVPSQHQSHVLTLDGSGLRIRRLPAWPTLIGGIQTYRSHILQVSKLPSGAPAEGGAQRALAEGRELAQQILTDGLAEQIEAWSCVTIADLGFFCDLPLECLARGDRLLGETVAINTMDSLPLACALLPRRRAIEDNTTAPALDLLATLRGTHGMRGKGTETPGDLGDARLELLRGAYGDRCRTKLDAELSVEALQQWRFEAPIAHILAHGAFEPALECCSGLALMPTDSDTGFFGTEEAGGLVGAPGMAEVVFLSACGAALGRPRIGDAPYQTTLAAMFLRAGAHTVVQSAGDLVLDPHLRLLAEVHRQVTHGATVAEALRTARASLAASGATALERLQHAQVQVFGLGNLAVFPKPSDGR